MKALNRRQSGAAAVMFVMLIPAMFGMVTLSIEGSRYLQTKARVSDVSEVAALALAAQSSDNDSVNQSIVNQYVTALLTDAESIENVSVARVGCDQISGCGVPGVFDEKGHRFTEYQVDITTRYASWFPKSGLNPVGFSENVDITSSAVARKFRGKAVDVLFVADFSDSMNDSWNGQKKLDKLKEVIVDVSKEVERYTKGLDEKNTVALIPFSFWTTEPNSTCYQTQLVSQSPASDIYRFEKSLVQHQKTIDQIGKPVDQVGKAGTNCVGYTTRYHTIPLTAEMSGFESALNRMKTFGATASFEGIIRAAEIAEAGDNPRRLILVLSDGMDVYTAPWHMEQLLNLGLCDTIRDSLESQTTSSGAEISAKIAVIGVDYDVESDPNLAACAGSENVFTATDMDDVYDKLLALINEEVGRLYFRGYDQNE